MVFSTLAKMADGRENKRIKQDTRSILIVLFTPREVIIKALKQRRLTSNWKFSSRTSYFCKVQLPSKPDIYQGSTGHLLTCLSDLDRSTQEKEGYGRRPAPFNYGLADVFPDRAKNCRPPRTCQLKSTTKPWTATPPTTLNPLYHHSGTPPIVVPISVSSLIITSPLPHRLEPSR